MFPTHSRPGARLGDSVSPAAPASRRPTRRGQRLTNAWRDGGFALVPSHPTRRSPWASPRSGAEWELREVFSLRGPAALHGPRGRSLAVRGGGRVVPPVMSLGGAAASRSGGGPKRCFRSGNAVSAHSHVLRHERPADTDESRMLCRMSDRTTTSGVAARTAWRP